MAQGGVRVTIGPRVPVRDGTLRPLREPLDASAFAIFDPRRADGAQTAATELVDRMIVECSLPRLSISPDRLFATVHHDSAGRARVLFVINPTTDKIVGRVGLGAEGTFSATDVLDGSIYRCKNDSLTVSLPARSVRMLALEPSG